MRTCGTKAPPQYAPNSELIDKINSMEDFQRSRQTGCMKKTDWPSQEIIATLQPQIKMVMNAIGKRGAYISDLTLLGDFEGVDFSKVSAELGIAGLTGREYIWELAQQLKNLAG